MNDNQESLRTFFQNYGKILLVFIFVLSIVFSVSIVFYANPGVLKISLLDVGQGDAILIESPSGKRILIDGGGSNKVLSKLSEELSFFVRDIDVILATHGDADHITGLIPALERFDIRTVVYAASGTTELFDDFYRHVEYEDATVTIARQGDRIIFHDGVTVYILSPNEIQSRAKDTNDTSIATLVTYGEHSFLFTGDLPIKKEGSLLTNKVLTKNVTVYKAGHHGSNTSSGEQLLSYIRPEYAVISAGKDNRYGHPHEETLTRLKKYSKEILSTIDRGTISFISDGRVLDVVTKK